jgi:hypothetical protein
MAIVTRSQIQNLMWPGLALINLDNKYWPLLSNRMYQTIETNKAFDVTVEMVPVGYARKMDETEPFSVQSNSILNKTEATHISYGAALEFSFEAIDDNLYVDQYVDGATQIKQSLLVTQDLYGAAPFNNGFSSTSPIGDGQPFFSNIHPLGQGAGTYSNLLSPASLSETSLTQMVTGIQTFPDPSGKVLNYQAKQLVVHPNLQFDAARILHDAERPGTANRDIGVFYNMDLISGGIIVNPYLQNTIASYLQSTCPDSAVWFKRNMNETSTWMDEKNRIVGMGAFMRFSFVITNARNAYGNQGI